MINRSRDQSSLEQKGTRNIRCPNCRRLFKIALVDGGKDIHFLNMVTWDCPKCGRHNITPFLNDVEH